MVGLHKQDTLKIPFHAVLAEGQDPLGNGHGQMAERYYNVIRYKSRYSSFVPAGSLTCKLQSDFF